MVYSNMVKFAHVEHIVAMQRVRINNAVRNDFLFHDLHQSDGSNIGYHLGVNLPPRFKIPNTGTLPAVPRPRLPLRLPPKYDS